MKTTVEIPDSVFRKVKSLAAGGGFSLKRFINEALEEKLLRARGKTSEEAPPWMKLAGSLRDRARDLRRVERAVAAECERIDPGAWE